MSKIETKPIFEGTTQVDKNELVGQEIEIIAYATLTSKTGAFIVVLTKKMQTFAMNEFVKEKIDQNSKVKEKKGAEVWLEESLECTLIKKKGSSGFDFFDLE